jgi:hypothetical protein
MTMCPHSKVACECQPQDGVMCPHGPQPPFQPWAPEPSGHGNLVTCVPHGVWDCPKCRTAGVAVADSNTKGEKT